MRSIERQAHIAAAAVAAQAAVRPSAAARCGGIVSPPEATRAPNAVARLPKRPLEAPDALRGAPAAAARVAAAAAWGSAAIGVEQELARAAGTELHLDVNVLVFLPRGEIPDDVLQPGAVELKLLRCAEANLRLGADEGDGGEGVAAAVRAQRRHLPRCRRRALRHRRLDRGEGVDLLQRLLQLRRAAHASLRPLHGVRAAVEAVQALVDDTKFAAPQGADHAVVGEEARRGGSNRQAARQVAARRARQRRRRAPAPRPRLRVTRRLGAVHLDERLRAA